jgi:dCMP deaminase
MSRISKTEYYLEIAKTVAKRSTCIRRQYGAVLVKNDRIIATGYNGSARGETNCCDVGNCWREFHGVPHGEQYEKCVAIHAEDNAIAQAGRTAWGATLYLAGFEGGKVIAAEPCLMCARKIKNAGIVNVIATEAEYEDKESR